MLPALVLMPLFIAVGIYTTIQGRRRVRQALRTTFAALRFNTPDGPVAGIEVRVVKVYKQGVPFAYDDVFNLPAGMRQISDSFWYCVAPGPSYFLAIPLVEVGFGRVDIQWVVRPLTEERLRVALQDDAAALRDALDPREGQLLA